MSSVFEEVQYVMLVSHRLDRFKQKNHLLYNFRCPICGDSQTSVIKARGYIYEGKRGLRYKCFNCDVAISFIDFLKQVDPGLYGQFLAEKYKEKLSDIDDVYNEDISFLDDLGLPGPLFTDTKVDTKPLSGLIRLDSLDNNHRVFDYLSSRSIPRDKWGRLAYTANIDKLCGKPSSGAVEPRLVMPCVNRLGEIFAVQGRILDGYSGVRYKSHKITKCDLPMLFGVDAVDITKRIFVTEGPIDSLFLSNSLAVCSAHLYSIIDMLVTHGFARAEIPQITLVFDNDKRNQHIVERMLKAVKMGYEICVFPDTVNFKDVNDMVLHGLDPEEIIVNSTYSGMLAELEISRWKKCTRAQSFLYLKNNRDTIGKL